MPAPFQGEIWWFKNLRVTETAGARVCTRQPPSESPGPAALAPWGPSTFLLSPHIGFFGSRGSRGGGGVEQRLGYPGPPAEETGAERSQARAPGFLIQVILSFFHLEGPGRALGSYGSY